MHVEMKSFLASGVFGQISFPVSRQTIAALLGEPDEWTTEQPRSKASIWKYANVEFHFESRSDAAWLIYADDLASFTGNSALVLDEWIIREQLRLEEAESALLQEGISYQRIPNPVLETVDLITASNVTLRFSIIGLMDSEYWLTSWSQQDQQRTR